ncbi:tetratricopeptide repeat protein [Streptomyces noursei]|uniref:tetratricopeptide repeat protein n=1 Tax=Streptomyces noursei TaxID=1971 RepID=UPI003DA36610
MNIGEHTAGVGQVHEGHGEREAALTELRRKLDDGLARTRLDKTQLASRSRLGRTTVHEAFRAGGPAPSAATVAALARVLRLAEAELLDLRRTAVGESGPVQGGDLGPGKPIGEWNPHDLEVHPAGTASDTSQQGIVSERLLPGYVSRAHDQVLASAVAEAGRGHSRMLVLVGTSSTGKTRACWEAVQPLTAQGWRLWHPFDPTRAEAALDELDRVAPRTVVWLNEAQHYLGNPHVGEQVAAALHTLLTHRDRRPVLVLGTLWPEYSDQYTALPVPGAADPHSRVRELLAGRTVTVPETFDEEALHAAATLAEDGDLLLADALTRVSTDGRIAQDLAGAPELLRRYEHGTPAAKAMLEAAMDARRLGVGLHLPQAFLTDAAIDYLSDHDYDELTDDWAEAAFAELARPVHGKQAPLRRTNTRPQRRLPGSPPPATTRPSTTGTVLRLADYLEQHGRNTRRMLCPPSSFWAAAHTHLTHHDDLSNLAEEARNRCRLQWAYHLAYRGAGAGSTSALAMLAVMREQAGDHTGAEALAHQATNAGDTWALGRLAEMREAAGDHTGAEALYRQAANAGDTDALLDLAEMREKAGDSKGAEALTRQAADTGNTSALSQLAEMREKAGDHEGAEALAHQAANAGDTYALLDLAETREKAGDSKGAEALYRQAADTGDTDALLDLAGMREAAGDREGAEALTRQAADTGNTSALHRLAEMREEIGDHTGAEALYRQAANAGKVSFRSTERWPYGLDPDGTPTLPWSVAEDVT